MVVTPEELVDNASLFATHAVEEFLVKGNQGADWRFIAVWAATSLEQLTKAALVKINVMLLAQPKEESILALAGVPRKSGRGPVTIGAADALLRYGKLNHSIESLRSELTTLLDLRNGVVHLVADAPNDFEAVFDTYLRATSLLLDDLEESYEDFWGENLETIVSDRLTTRAKTIEEQVRAKLAQATAGLKAVLDALPTQNDRENFIKGREAITRARIGGWPQDCPSGDHVGAVEIDAEVDWDDGVPYAYPIAVAYGCSVCDLSLAGQEMDAAFGDIDLSKVDLTEMFGDPGDYFDYFDPGST